MKNKKNITVLSLVFIALVSIYFGKNYLENKKEINLKNTNIINSLEEAREGVPTIIMFKTDTCPYCVEMEKELSLVSKEREGRFNIYYARLEEEKNIDLADKYDAKVVPTTVFLDKEGREFYIHQGLMKKDNIEVILNSLGVK